MSAIAEYKAGTGPLRTQGDVIAYCRGVAISERKYGFDICADAIEALIGLLQGEEAK